MALEPQHVPGDNAEAGPSRPRPPSRPPPPSTDPRKLLTPGAVRRALHQLQSHSRQVDADLASTVDSSLHRIASSQESISSLAPQIDLLSEEATVLRTRLVDAAQTSDRITGAVRVLDDEKRRLATAKAWLTATQDLKASLATLASAVDQGDWELATRHAQKAMAVPLEVVESEFAQRVVPSTEQPLAPAQTLLELRKKLLDVFTQRFHHATTQSKDEAEASRFFRLFPLVGWRKEGLQAYSTFARGMIREKGKQILAASHRGNVGAAQLLTALFEQLALLIDTHQRVVDRHYGEGNFAAGVMPGLQEECDEIGGKIVEGWVERTAVMRRLAEANAYSFSYLANLGPSGVGAGSSPNVAANKFGLPGRPSTPMGRPGTPAARTSVDEPQVPDGREVDRLLHELAAMAARWATYRRFLKGRLTSEKIDTAGSGEQRADGGFKDFHRRSSIDASAVAAAVASPALGENTTDSARPNVITASKLLRTSSLAKRFDTLLADIYCPLERWYLRSSLEKAHRIDTFDPTSRPLTSTILDDAFFLLRASSTRILSTCHPPTIATALRSVRTIADDDYAQVLVRRMEAVWRSVGGALSGPDGPRKETATREMRSGFVRYLNVLGVSVRYAERVVGDLGSEGHLGSLFPGDDDEEDEEDDDDEAEAQADNAAPDLPRQPKALIRHHLTTHLGALPTRLRSAQRTELEHLFDHVTRPRLRTLLFADVFRDVRYDVRTEEEYAAAEERDWVRRRFARGWDAIVATPFRETFDEENFEEYVGLAVEAFVRPWEKAIITAAGAGGGGGASPLPAFSRFTELGALRFDKDWRAIAAHVGEQTQGGRTGGGGGSGAAVRDRFARISQIAYVLCLDEDEDEDGPVGEGEGGVEGEQGQRGGIYESGATSGFSWRLSASEVRAVRALRTAA